MPAIPAVPAVPEIKQWADELDRLLQKAASTRSSGDSGQIVAMHKELRRFKEQSPDYADALDTQASLAIFDLDLDQTEDAVSKLQERSAEVYRLSKLISGISDEARANANTLGGMLAVQAIDAASSAIASFKKLRDELTATQPDQKAITAEIDKTLTSIQNLRNKLEKT
jgi:seryl-tRNA synthetase